MENERCKTLRTFGWTLRKAIKVSKASMASGTCPSKHGEKYFFHWEMECKNINKNTIETVPVILFGTAIGNDLCAPQPFFLTSDSGLNWQMILPPWELRWPSKPEGRWGRRRRPGLRGSAPKNCSKSSNPKPAPVGPNPRALFGTKTWALAAELMPHLLAWLVPPLKWRLKLNAFSRGE